MKLSIIIPCLNEEAYLAKLLKALKNQNWQEFEVLVVDSASTDNTVKVAMSFTEQLRLKVVKSKRGVANARNDGAAAAAGEWLLFLDADVMVSPDFLECSWQEITRRKLTMASNRFIPGSLNLFDRLGSWLTYRYMRVAERSKQPMAGGYCIWITRALHNQIGGFDPKLKLAEDHEYLQRAKAAGGMFRYLVSTPLIVSLRRFEEHGRLRMLLRYSKAELYRFSHKGRVEKEVVSYEFGEHGRKDK